MTALDAPATKGYKAMQECMSTAARVRRQLKAGRPRTTRSLDLNSLEAVGRLIKDAHRAQLLMGEAGLNPGDVRLGLIIRTATDLHCKWYAGNFQPFYEGVSALAGAEFLGILWRQTDREIEDNGVPLTVHWLTLFTADVEAQKQILALRDFIVAGGTRMQAI